MKKSDNKVVNLFEESNKGIQKTVITETMKMKRGGSLSNPVLATKPGVSYQNQRIMLSSY